jgi:hypothetical protein
MTRLYRIILDRYNNLVSYWVSCDLPCSKKIPVRKMAAASMATIRATWNVNYNQRQKMWNSIDTILSETGGSQRTRTPSVRNV